MKRRRNRLLFDGRQWRFLVHPRTYVAEANHECDEEEALELAPTSRQLATARAILKRLRASGVLLADDVGLGKTLVAAIVALVVARARRGRGNRLGKVRILTHNLDLMGERWREELCRQWGHFPAEWGGDVDRFVYLGERTLRDGEIQIASHGWARTRRRKLDCDLLIVDEAHKGKGENSRLGRALERRTAAVGRLLLLTATPFSIELHELKRFLTLLGARSTAITAIDEYANTLRGLNDGSDPETADDALAKRLYGVTKRAVAALRDHVIRHSLSNLSAAEKKLHAAPITRAGGNGTMLPWPELRADPGVLEALVRTDRLLRLVEHEAGPTNDARFHVGWSELCHKVRNAKQTTQQAVRDRVRHHAQEVLRTARVGRHPKIAAAVDVVSKVVNAGERVLVFCHHHATAEELAIALHEDLGKTSGGDEAWCDTPRWHETWEAVLEPKSRSDHALVDWLSSAGVVAQMRSWGPGAGAWRRCAIEEILGLPARGGRTTIREEALRLRKRIRRARRSGAARSLVPAKSAPRVAALCNTSVKHPATLSRVFGWKTHFAMLAFNSPFGPDVLVTTDRLSEGVDLHRFCRTLIHYELDPSPIRTFQREGRIRRVKSWSATKGWPIRYEYPAFAGTRDERLVRIMRHRLGCFELLLGGAGGDVTLTDDGNTADARVERVLTIARRMGLGRKTRELGASNVKRILAGS